MKDVMQKDVQVIGWGREGHLIIWLASMTLMEELIKNNMLVRLSEFSSNMFIC